MEKIVTLFKVIRVTVGSANWTINHDDFDKLFFFVIDVVDFDKEIEDFRDLLEDMVRKGRKGNSLSYWLSDGVLSVFRGYSNSLHARLEFSLDGKAYM